MILLTRYFFNMLFVGFFLACLSTSIGASETGFLHHDITVTILPDKHRLEVTDNLTLVPKAQNYQQRSFLLNANLHVTEGAQLSADQSGLKGLPVPVRRYELPEGTRQVIVKYSGEIVDQVTTFGNEFTATVDDSAGLISNEGVYLTPATFWYPALADEFVTFSLDIDLPQGWQGVSQGARKKSGNRAVWVEDKPQQEIYLIAAPFVEYNKAQDDLEAMVFLRQPDPALAQTYLDITAQYIDMYQNLIGSYPYQKFALVENFWETGFGMPSFTLLGPEVIRLPFIPYTSYPHEILHNWWGNGVYVDFQQGNWSEGLTSYLADHSLKEMRGAGVEYRRSVLQNYANFVNDNKEFSLAAFRSRHGSSSQAIGYGKGMMLFHMLRQKLGDELFVKALQQFYQNNKFKVAGYDDWLKVFEQVSGQQLDTYFEQWLMRTGAPMLEVLELSREQQKDSWISHGVIKQTQAGKAYRLSVPLFFTLEGHEQAYGVIVEMNEAKQDFSIKLPAKPLRLDVDPEYDLFRRVDQGEIPAALSLLFGAEKALIVLPASANQTLRQSYQQIGEYWRQAYPAGAEIALDSDLKQLPKDRAIWLLGKGNRFAAEFMQSTASEIRLDSGDIEFNQQSFQTTEHTLVFTARNPGTTRQGVAWLVAERQAAIPGLLRKLPHYSKYSYLMFEGDAPQNVLKGQWLVMDSPLSVMFDESAAAIKPQFPKRPALLQ